MRDRGDAGGGRDSVMGWLAATSGRRCRSPAVDAGIRVRRIDDELAGAVVGAVHHLAPAAGLMLSKLAISGPVPSMVLAHADARVEPHVAVEQVAAAACVPG